MATYTSYLNLKKPEGGERYALADFNANMQKIDDFATLVNPKKGTLLNASNITSDTAILSLANGSYPVNGGVTPYLPYDYGTLIIDNTGSTAYGAFIFITTGGDIYTRQKNNSGGWRTAWQQMALNSQINTLSSQMATELASRQYVLSTNSASTLTEQILAFCENHRGQSNYTISFFMSASNAPSDIPANSNTWKYAFGEVRIRISPLSGGIDGVIILYAFSANQMAIRYIANSAVSSEWKVFS